MGVPRLEQLRLLDRDKWHATIRIVVPLLAVFASAFAPSRVQSAETGEPLVLERTIRLNGVAGRIDHMAIDLGRKRLLVAELGDNSVDLIDLTSGKAVHRIPRDRIGIQDTVSPLGRP